jgi:tRNA(adenine34) deaminase
VPGMVSMPSGPDALACERAAWARVQQSGLAAAVVHRRTEVLLPRADAKAASRDEAMMARCIELARCAAGVGEYPFGTVIVLDGQIIAEAVNSTMRERDVTRHAEIAALGQAQQTVGRAGLRRATLYSNIEPCAMCAYCIREAWIGRVVYALASPIMGGQSRWSILRDDLLCARLPEVFGAAPEVVSGVLLHEAQQAWRDWNPFAWQMIKMRGLLTAPASDGGEIRVHPAQRRPLRHQLAAWLSRIGVGRPRPRLAAAPRQGDV